MTRTIFEALRADHDDQRRMIDELVSTSGDSDERDRLFGILRDELEAHAAAEELTLYAAMMQDEVTVTRARHSVAEHKELDDFIERLAKMDYSNPNWVRVAEDLRHRLLHHLEEEEKEVFVSAGMLLTDAAKLRLGTEFVAAKTDWQAA